MSATSDKQSRGIVVVIEDTAEIRDEVATILRLERFEVHAAADGQDGLRLIEQVSPDVVMSDVMMPMLDGFATLTALRSDPRWTTLQFVFLTARADRDAVRQGMALGADDYLTKPFTAEELIAAVESALARRTRLEQEAEARADRVRVQLSAALPHELRTPLHVVLGYAEILADGARELPPDEIEALARKLLVGARQLSRTTENVLLSAQLDVLEAQSCTPDPRRARPCGHGLVEAAHVAADSHGRSGDLHVDVETELEATIDDTSLRRIVSEIVDNACKFSQPGSRITLVGRQVRTCLRLLIRDAGIGMSHEQIRHIAAYAQFERDRREQPGLGLGLALATRLARLHGGAVTVESNRDGPGVTVTIELPSSGANDPTQRTQEIVEGHGLA